MCVCVYVCVCVCVTVCVRVCTFMRDGGYVLHIECVHVCQLSSSVYGTLRRRSCPSSQSLLFTNTTSASLVRCVLNTGAASPISNLNVFSTACV